MGTKRIVFVSVKLLRNNLLGDFPDNILFLGRIQIFALLLS